MGRDGAKLPAYHQIAALTVATSDVRFTSTPAVLSAQIQGIRRRLGERVTGDKRDKAGFS